MFGSFATSAPVYSDGSCLCPSFVNLAAAGTYLVQLDNHSQVDRAVCSPLPG